MKMEIQNNTKFIVKTKKNSHNRQTNSLIKVAAHIRALDYHQQVQTPPMRPQTNIQWFHLDWERLARATLRSISRWSGQIWTQDGPNESEEAAEEQRKPSRSEKTTKLDELKLEHRNYTSQLSNQYLQ